MKYIGITFLLLLMMLFGISLGGSYNNLPSKAFEKELDEFEENITSPNNQIIPKYYEEYKINKIAKTIEDFIDYKIKNTILNRIK